MTSTLHVFRSEVKVFLQDRFNVCTSLLFLLMCLYGVWNGLSWMHTTELRLKDLQSAEAREFSDNRRSAEAILAGQTKAASPFADPTSPGVVSGISRGGRSAILPPTKLAGLSIGQSDLHPSYIKVGLQPEQDLLTHYEIENPQNLLEGRFDLAFAVVCILPLFVLAISYTLLSVEIENGTLALLLAQGGDLRRIIAARILVRLFVCLGCCAVALLVELAFSSGPLSTTSVFGSLLFLAAVSLYSLLWLSISLAANLVVRRSSASAILLLGVWVLFVLIVPGLINIVASQMYPLPSRLEQIAEMRRASNDAASRGAVTLQRYLNDHPDLAPRDATAGMSDYYASTLALRGESQEAVQPILDNFAAKRQARERSVRLMRVLSPAMMMQSAVEDISGTGEGRYNDFLKQVHAYYLSWKAFFAPRIFAGQKMTPQEYDAIPRFQYQAECIKAVVLRVLVSMVAIAVPTLFITLWAAALIKRFKPLF